MRRTAYSLLGICSASRPGAKTRHPEQPPNRAGSLSAVHPASGERAEDTENDDVTTEGYRGHTRFDRTQMCINIDYLVVEIEIANFGEEIPPRRKTDDESVSADSSQQFDACVVAL